jgi:hypothetical protein
MKICNFVAIGLQPLFKNGGPGGGCNSLYYGDNRWIGCSTCKSVFHIIPQVWIPEVPFHVQMREATKDAEFPYLSYPVVVDFTTWSGGIKEGCPYTL